MRKKIFVVLMALATAAQLTACSKTCKADGCSSKDIYEDGYCRLHYYENVGGNILKDIFN